MPNKIINRLANHILGFAQLVPQPFIVLYSQTQNFIALLLDSLAFDLR
jgi:hypothetical protein